MYTTHIYAYDGRGNWRCYKVIDANKVKSTPAPVPTYKPVVKSTVKPSAKPSAKPSTKPTAKSTGIPASKSLPDNNFTKQEVSVPAAVYLKSCKAKKYGVVKIKWSKVQDADGYEIQYSRNKNFKKKTKEYEYSKLENKKRLVLKSKKKYYIRVRAFKFGKIQYKVSGAWSNIKKVKTKK